jgi:hypothetical protein
MVRDGKGEKDRLTRLQPPGRASPDTAPFEGQTIVEKLSERAMEVGHEGGTEEAFDLHRDPYPPRGRQGGHP